MSSGIQVERVCLYCNCKFIARTTKTRYCSHRCNSRHYKQVVKEEKIAASNIQSSAMGLLKTKVDFPELSGKPFLTINESSALLNVSPVTLRRWIKEGMIPTQQIGKKHIIKRADIDAMLAK
ncbi:MAG: helix-turn-helix domain-containing protein [Sphingobacteriales bacterium]|nr:helix-turn-helix domain-containing protein [Sphingobacteriales bacterium]